MKKEGIKTNIEIEGIILTEEAISELKVLQELNNEALHDAQNNLADAICFLVLSMDILDPEPDNNSKIVKIISHLSYIRGIFNSFRKP